MYQTQSAAQTQPLPLMTPNSLQPQHITVKQHLAHFRLLEDQIHARSAQNLQIVVSSYRPLPQTIQSVNYMPNYVQTQPQYMNPYHQADHFVHSQPMINPCHQHGPPTYSDQSNVPRAGYRTGQHVTTPFLSRTSTQTAPGLDPGVETTLKRKPADSNEPGITLIIDWFNPYSESVVWPWECGFSLQLGKGH